MYCYIERKKAIHIRFGCVRWCDDRPFDIWQVIRLTSMTAYDGWCELVSERGLTCRITCAAGYHSSMPRGKGQLQRSSGSSRFSYLFFWIVSSDNRRFGQNKTHQNLHQLWIYWHFISISCGARVGALVWRSRRQPTAYTMKMNWTNGERKNVRHFFFMMNAANW